MKKILITTGILSGIVFTLFVAGRLTGAIQIYSAPTKANEPTIKLDERFIASNLKKPTQFDFIAFTSHRNYGLDTTQNYIFVYRLIGLPGHTIEIRDGIAFIDGKNVDTDLSLQHRYKVSAAYANLVKAGDFEPTDTDSGYMTLPDIEARKIGAARFRVMYDDQQASALFGHAWTADSFGPLKIPPDHYFVLGDNRHGAMDSRYIGLIPVTDWKGTILYKR
ncbi:MAG: signal peptidase [Chitinophagaceae bacterium]|jgi:signal peptidase I|nr:signal peptidase [Chitinophagaceae bacterium]